MTSTFAPFYLFLDFDGVLHDRRASDDDLFIYADRLGLLLEHYPEVVVVVSSSAGKTHLLAALQAACGSSLGPRLKDVTPIVKRVLDGIPAFQRFKEIAYWLATHPAPTDDGRDPGVDALARHDWIALDDAAQGFSPACSQLIHVVDGLGLTISHFTEIEARVAGHRRCCVVPRIFDEN